jgi:hypothetical protein
MLNWFRRRLGRLDRRWINDAEERARHHEVVERRLPNADNSTDAPVTKSAGKRE